MKHTALLLACLLCVVLPAAPGRGDGDPVDPLVDRLFAQDPAERAAARRELLALGDGVLERVLARIEARQPAEAVVRIHAAQDLRADEEWWARALARIRGLAAGGQVRERNGALVVVAPEAVQERIAAELSELRRFLGTFVRLEARVVRPARMPGTLPADLAEDAVAAFLEEHAAKISTAPKLMCHSGQRASVEVVNRVTYVSGFEVKAGGAGYAADPVVDAVNEGLSLALRPVADKDGTVQVALDATQVELARPMRTLTLPLPHGAGAQVQVPETRTLGVTRLLACRPGRVAVADLGGGSVLLLAAAVVPPEKR